MTDNRPSLITITSDHGRIGPLWWFNSNRIPRQAAEGCPIVTRRWGTFGFGRHVRFMLEVD
jgi:hypothetical protein